MDVVKGDYGPNAGENEEWKPLRGRHLQLPDRDSEGQKDRQKHITDTF